MPKGKIMRATAALLVGTSLLAVAVPAAAQTQPEQTAQAGNPPPAAVPVQDQGAIIVTATKRASTVQDVLAGNAHAPLISAPTMPTEYSSCAAPL